MARGLKTIFVQRLESHFLWVALYILWGWPLHISSWPLWNSKLCSRGSFKILFKSHPFFFGPPPAVLVCPPICPHSPLNPLTLSVGETWRLILGTSLSNPSNLKLQRSSNQIMTDCDQCQEMGKVEHVSNSYSYYAQAIGIFLLVLSVVGG